MGVALVLGIWLTASVVVSVLVGAVVAHAGPAAAAAPAPLALVPREPAVRQLADA